MPVLGKQKTERKTSACFRLQWKKKLSSPWGKESLKGNRTEEKKIIDTYRFVYDYKGSVGVTKTPFLRSDDRGGKERF